jgi:hypothetical protein
MSDAERIANLWRMYDKFLDIENRLAASRVLVRLNELGARLADRPSLEVAKAFGEAAEDDDAPAGGP